jgi:hypothetical protein
MRSSQKITGMLLPGLLILAACVSTNELTSTPAVASVSSQPAPTRINVLPTPSSPGDLVIWRDLQVSMLQAEITDRFLNEFGSQRLPSPGKKFLWVHVALETIGEDEMALPESENFSVLYAESEFKPIYGHRQGYADYTSLGSSFFPGQTLEGWLRFDIPDGANLRDLWFVFVPGSAQVGASPSSPNYPYADDKATFVWRCGT